MSKEKKDFKFDKMAAGYDDALAGKGSKRFYDLLLREIEIFPNTKVLDVGCGTGALLGRLADTCPIIGYGIDLEENMIAVAKSKRPDFNFQKSRCDNTPFEDNEFDIIISCMAYHHFDNKQGFIKEAARIVKPGGEVYIVDPRFPWFLRKLMNGVARLANVAGAFCTPREIEMQFSEAGFSSAGFAYDGYAQVVKLRRR